VPRARAEGEVSKGALRIPAKRRRPARPPQHLVAVSAATLARLKALKATSGHSLGVLVGLLAAAAVVVPPGRASRAK
jgi:hypothetical protein